jgi:mRNA interferase RelE/StbE
MSTYRVEIGSRADGQLAALDPVIGASVERRIQWLAQYAEAMVHRRLVGMPEDLAGLCKLRIGDWRLLYWVYPAQRLIRIYRIQHRSEVYRDI